MSAFQMGRLVFCSYGALNKHGSSSPINMDGVELFEKIRRIKMCDLVPGGVALGGGQGSFEVSKALTRPRGYS